MNPVIDIVNFNADASCLSCERWLSALKGGKNSEFYLWLKIYVDLEKKVVLGFPGATISDIVSYNPEAIELINSHQNIFEIIVRPYSHDIALLRSDEGFAFNVSLGKKITEANFENISYAFLPPEFMLTANQLSELSRQEFKTVFLNPRRFSKDMQGRIAKYPYQIEGLENNSLGCIIFNGQLTSGFLHGIHHFNAKKWNKMLEESEDDLNFNWRDGESAFLLPDTLERERAWLKDEVREINRSHLKEIEIDFKALPKEAKHLRSYPVHSFTAWLQEMRMLRYVQRVIQIEDNVFNESIEKQSIWLQLINSDILSAVEKESPKIEILDNQGQKTCFMIYRAEKGVEGEALLQWFKNGDKFKFHANLEFFEKKINSRIAYILPFLNR